MDEKIDKGSKQVFTIAQGPYQNGVGGGEDGDDFVPGQKHVNERGINWWITGLFIVGEMAGGGLVAMPTAFVDASLWGGVAVTILGAMLTGYTGIQLGENWTMLQERWPEYRIGHCRKPYPEMAGRAIGNWAKHLVSLCIDVTQFGIAVVFMLLASTNIHSFLLAFFNVNINFCFVILIVALLLLPAIMLKSPKDFWPAVVMAMVTTSTAVVLICVGSLSDATYCKGDGKTFYPEIKFKTFFLAFGTIMFAYGGHAAFPTIQHDMKKPYQFNRSVILAYTIIVFMYMPASVLGYLSYGGSLRGTVIFSLQIKWMQQTTNILITLHVILTLTIVFSPINQELEEVFNLPHHFGWQRVVARTCIMVAVVFVALSMPHFGPVLDLVGGSTITLLTVSLPGIFHLYLVQAKKKAGGKQNTDHKATMAEIFTKTPIHILLANLFVIFFGLIGGVAATWSAVNELSGVLTTPCYVLPFMNTTVKAESLGHTYCCGPFQNISRYGNASEYCMPL